MSFTKELLVEINIYICGCFEEYQKQAMVRGGLNKVFVHNVQSGFEAKDVVWVHWSLAMVSKCRMVALRPYFRKLWVPHLDICTYFIKQHKH